MDIKPSASLKQKTINSIIWSFIRRFGTLIISFIANLILARLLFPKDFGSIGMITVFLAISETLINGGLGSALIQKKNPTNIDYSTVFYWNLSLSIFLYVILYFSAPSISKFYNMPILSKLLRVQGIILIINSFNIIQNNILIKKLNFKTLAIRDLISNSIGAVIGISLAFMQFGVWSLVIRTLVVGIFNSILLWGISSWRPSFAFSWDSFKELFSFGSLMLLYSLTDTVTNELQSLIIGKKFSAQSLGFYTQAKKIHEIPQKGLTQPINQVTFPVFSTIQDKPATLKKYVSKSMKTITFISFPLMVLLIIIAKPLIKLLLSDKWLASAPLFQLLCLSGMLFPINSNCINVMKAMGKSNYVFYSALIKRFITISFIIIGLQFGIMAMIFFYSISIYFWFIINAFILGKLINYGIKKQINEMGLTYVTSFIIGGIVFAITKNLSVNYFMLMLIQISIFITFYLGLSYILKVEGYYYLKTITKEQIRKLKNE
ncbi:MAG: lipopolysaccharide biosynthesis protein [Bacteroidales bacterium]|mgnify:CR=1 FL=1|nr:lipopolysaccharide biosynthesis protein [Bacteroidales bacterium]